MGATVNTSVLRGVDVATQSESQNVKCLNFKTSPK
jgi:hypothetical protein